MEVKDTIKKFLDLILNHDSEKEDLGKLITALDELVFSVNHVEFEFDEAEYPEPPEEDYDVIRNVVEKRYPSLGFYNMPLEISEKVGETEVSIGDAIDDIADIVGDLKEVLWRFENTSVADALWHYEFSFRSHWGRHLRELQLYLHDKYW